MVSCHINRLISLMAGEKFISSTAVLPSWSWSAVKRLVFILQMVVREHDVHDCEEQQRGVGHVGGFHSAVAGLETTRVPRSHDLFVKQSVGFHCKCLCYLQSLSDRSRAVMSHATGCIIM